MATKRELIKVARKGNYQNRGGSELACSECGCYDFTGKHEEGCSVGALLQLIEENVSDNLCSICHNPRTKHADSCRFNKLLEEIDLV